MISLEEAIAWLQKHNAIVEHTNTGKTFVEWRNYGIGTRKLRSRSGNTFLEAVEKAMESEGEGLQTER